MGFTIGFASDLAMRFKKVNILRARVRLCEMRDEETIPFPLSTLFRLVSNHSYFLLKK